jgi:hypothetical protein
MTLPHSHSRRSTLFHKQTFVKVTDRPFMWEVSVWSYRPLAPSSARLTLNFFASPPPRSSLQTSGLPHCLVTPPACLPAHSPTSGYDRKKLLVMLNRSRLLTSPQPEVGTWVVYIIITTFSEKTKQRKRTPWTEPTS